MLTELRKVVTFDEDIYRDGEKEAQPPLRVIGVAAVVANPWAGRGFVEDLSPEIIRMAPVLGKLLTDRLIALAGSGEANGKFIDKEYQCNSPLGKCSECADIP